MNFPPVSRSLLAVLIAAGLCSCQDDEQVQRLQEEVRLIGEIQRDAQSEASRLSTQVQTLTTEKERLRQENQKLQEAMETLRKESIQLQKDFDAYRNNYKTSMRTRGVGMSLGTLVVNGMTYDEVVCRQVTDDFLSIMHRTGPARFEWDQLPEPIRAKFGIEKESQYVRHAFAQPAAALATQSYDHEVSSFDKEMVKTMVEYQKLSTERSAATLEMIRAKTEISKRQRDGRDTTEYEQLLNQSQVKLATLTARMDSLRLYQNGLLVKDPRRKKKR